MKKNMGTVDKVLRILVAIVIAGLFLANIISGTVALVLFILAGILVVTAFFGFCPLYLPFGISTQKRNTQSGSATKVNA